MMDADDTISVPSTEPPRSRQFGIFDAMVSIAVIAFLLTSTRYDFGNFVQQANSWYRTDVTYRSLPPPTNQQQVLHQRLLMEMLVNYRSGVIWSVIQMAQKVVLIVAPAFLLIRWNRPRPHLRALLRQPGTIAGLSVALGFLLVTNWLHVLFIGLNPRLLPPVAIGGTVAIAWAGLALSRRWEAERGWIDRTGRVLGVAAISIGLISYAKYGI